ncbi:MAG: bifunctional 5,10-methylenetetrahydrofolate dehydrogenase/5,10-methenyltetrahydrofolate cyclohydrolase [Candidatus Sungbacteria bacterium]|uniref:Bifunctional protein FolD n=1 Tax=Candidatus Sungiibacteriota bacterium TaxID=2750080 RepID=A0A932YXK1_9BACT|nr:bifunctional 5,10-methylenetetrahydrofolate dehydrogenase/5,10-methenyltetrahydrofolate cyclohydrolase [Candidatus Sungbacteria bacterium]
MALLDGKQVSQKIIAGLKDEIAKISKKLSLGVVVVGEDAAVKKFIAQKRKVADELGIDFRIYNCDPGISTSELRSRLKAIVHDARPAGIIIQLPLPSHLNAQYILNSIPPEKDVDVLSARAMGDFAAGKSNILPPVVGAIKMLLAEYGIDYRGKYVAVIGAGTLVGKPVALWLLNEKISFSVAEAGTPDISEFTKNADVIISGAGRPGLIRGDMVKAGAVVIDCGTTEAGGELRGDVDFDSVAPKASFIAPVPGGVGPVTVAMIYQNLITLVKSRR